MFAWFAAPSNTPSNVSHRGRANKRANACVNRRGNGCMVAVPSLCLIAAKKHGGLVTLSYVDGQGGYFVALIPVAGKRADRRSSVQEAKHG